MATVGFVLVATATRMVNVRPIPSSQCKSIWNWKERQRLLVHVEFKHALKVKALKKVRCHLCLMIRMEPIDILCFLGIESSHSLTGFKSVQYIGWYWIKNRGPNVPLQSHDTARQDPWVICCVVGQEVWSSFVSKSQIACNCSSFATIVMDPCELLRLLTDHDQPPCLQPETQKYAQKMCRFPHFQESYRSGLGCDRPRS